MSIINSFLNNLFYKTFGPRRLVQILGGIWKPSQPTQSDKPSPHSTLTINQAQTVLKKGFPYNMGYQVSFISNTNSMEPFLDDNTVIAIELLNKEWREGRLRIQPLTRGDIVIWEIDKFRFIHALTEFKLVDGEKEWLIQGYNNLEADFNDHYFKETDIVARMVAVLYTQQKRKGD